MWAGYMALVNEQAVSNGNSPLGFINPAIYAIGEGSSYDTDFHDCLTGGNTDGCTVGYDLSTGWGSPNGNALIEALAGSATGPFTLTVTEAGTGSGTVSSSPSGISCPSTCSASFSSGTVVTLTATDRKS